jgi:DNA-binding MarR family transcriptional regulator
VRDDDGLTMARLRLLWALETEGPMIGSELKDALGITARSVTSLVDALDSPTQ